MVSLLAGEDGEEGLANQFQNYLESMTSSGSGMLQGRKESINNNLKRIDTRIDAMEARLEQRQKTLEAQFSAMETLVSGLNAQSSYLSQQMTAITNIMKREQTMNGYTNQYLANTVISASPEQLMLMLYDGAVRFLSLRPFRPSRTARPTNGPITSTRPRPSSPNLPPPWTTPRMPSWPTTLTALYGYMLRRMMQANLKNDARPLVEVKELLADLRATWAQAIEINKTGIARGRRHALRIFRHRTCLSSPGSGDVK